MVATATGKVWVSFRNLGVLHYDGTAWVQYAPQTTANQLPSLAVHKLCLDNSGALWMANSLSLTRRDANGYKNYFYTTPYDLINNPITGVTESQGKVFLSTFNGLHVLDTITSAWQSFTTQNSSLPADSIFSLFTESTGAVWLCTSFGYARFFQGSISPYTPLLVGLPVNQVLSIAVTGNDTLLAGANDVLYRKRGTNWIDLDSIAFGRSKPVTWCDTLSYGLLSWEGVHYNFCTNLFVTGSDAIVVIRNSNYSVGIFVIEPTGSLKYTWAYDDVDYCTVASVYKSDSILIGGGLLSNDLRRFELPVFGNYTAAAAQTPLVAPYDINISIPPSYKSGSIAFLEGNMIRSGVLNRGDWAWNPVSQIAQYEVPVHSGRVSVFASAIWLGGFDQSDNLYTAAMTYRQAGVDFQPGPLDTQGNISATSGTDFDHIWLTRKSDVDEFRYQYAMGNVTNGIYPVPAYVSDWPAYYNDPAFPQRLDPFVDVNGDSAYNPLDGDYPDIRGDQMSWCVFNDQMTKTETNSAPMKVEIHATASSYGCSNAPDDLSRLLSYTTLYHFDIYNRGQAQYDSCFFGIWSDFDLGNASDDYVGSNLSSNSFFVTNGDPDDDNGFGVCPPTQSVAFLNGPEAPAGDGLDNNHNGLVDEPNEELGLSVFTYYVNLNNVPNGNPQGAGYYNYLSGSWQDGALITYGGDGRGAGIGATATPTRFMFPDTSDAAFTTPWTMTTAGFIPDDVRGVGSFGPFTLPVGGVRSFGVAFITGPNDLVQQADLIRRFRTSFRNGLFKDYSSNLPAIQGPAQITSSGGSANYILPYQNIGAQYIWTITNGLILSGQGTNAITVSWGPSGTGEVFVEVLEPSNPCGMHQKLPVIIGSQGFGQIANESTARVYPNPTQHQLQIETPDNRISTYALRSTTGQLLDQKSYTGTCDVSTLAPGMYFIELQDVKGVVLVRKMFLKQ